MSEQAVVADSPTIEDRVGALFGGEPLKKPVQPSIQLPPQEAEAPEEAQESQEAPPEGEPTPEYAEVEYEGETYQVPPKLKEAIIRQSDYTKKTQELAETRKLVEHTREQQRVQSMQAEFSKSVESEMSDIAAIDQQLNAYGQINWRDIPADDRTLHMLEMQKLEKMRSAKVDEVRQKHATFEAHVQEQVKGLQEKSQKLLKERIPQWNETTAKETLDWAISNGLSEDEVKSIADPRHAEILWKAFQYDKARKSAQPAVAQAKAAKVGNSNPMPQKVKEQLAFRKALQKSSGDPVGTRRAVEQRVESLFRNR